MAGRIETLLAAERRLLLDISHELRSPLARLGVAVELARSGEDANAALNRIQKESDRLNALVGQLLQVTRAEGDPNSLRRDPVRLDELVAATGGRFRHRSRRARGCRMRYERREPVTVEGDPELLRRARGKRHPQRHPLCAAAIRRGSLAGAAQRSAVVDVRDHGPGVPEEALPRLFDAFYRVESDRNRYSRRHRAGAFHRAPGHRAAQGRHPRAQRPARPRSGDGVASGRWGITNVKGLGNA